MQTSIGVPQTVAQLVGQTVGSCRIKRLLGHGRLSAVYQAQQVTEQRTVAITAFIVPEQFSMQARQRFLARFTREAAALATLHHPHILPVYEYGEQSGFPYLVTPYVTEGSLANVLKLQGRCTPEYTLHVLEQIAAALDYAHSKGVSHGTLKPSNILLNGEEEVQIAGFGLVRLLEMRGIEPATAQYGHLLSVAGTFLGAPEYIAPECVQGQPADARADIYALGILLFELLSGKPPFTGTNPLEVAMQHVQSPFPSLHALCPDVPEALEHIIKQALRRDPTRRYLHASDLVTAFARVLHYVKNAPEGRGQASASANKDMLQQTATGSWQILPPIMTGQLPALPAMGARAKDETDPATLVGWPETTKPVQGPSYVPTRSVPIAGPSSHDLDAAAIDPFEWWSQTFSMQATGQTGTPATTAKVASTTTGSVPIAGSTRATSGARQKTPTTPGKMSRRKVVALLAGGTLAAGILGAGGFSLARILHPGGAINLAPTVSKGNTPTAKGTGTAHGGKPTPTTKKPAPQPMHKGNPMPTAHPNPTQPPQATQPPPPPTPVPTQPPPAHTGTVIGATNQALNSAKGFNNPADGQGSLLVHLPNNNFVAYEMACTHEKVPVAYDPNSHMLVCPAHGAIFDPANGGSLVQGPGNGPLPRVTIRVNADGTITTG